MAKKRPKWSTNVSKAMEKKWTCPEPCKLKYSGREMDAEGNVLRVFDCHDMCPYKRRMKL